MARSTAASPPREADGGLEALLHAEETLAEALEIARARARETVEEARRHAESLRQQSTRETEQEIAALEAAAQEELRDRLEGLADERQASLERYRAAMEERLDELATWTVERLLADLEEPTP